ncbi:MAG: deoxyribonuclease IV [Nitrospirae bacterium]|nr:deoxyribonuclease IV [Nitrospirota bacterium]
MKTAKRKRTQEFRIGVHTSISGGISRAVERAASLNCNTMQIFSHNPRQWRKNQISQGEAGRFSILRQKYDIRPIFIHASYLINLASLSGEVLSKSISLLSYELMNADKLGAEYVILHTGSARGEDERKARGRAVKAILRSLNAGRYRASLILENTAGRQGDITSSMRTLAEIIDLCNCDGIGGVCIDTCHAFSSGYDLASNEGIEKLISEIDRYIGLDKLKLIHLNDSKQPMGSRIDRHEHIGRGFIGAGGFRKMLSDRRILDVPLILETPKMTEDDDRNNLKKVYEILSHAV